MTQAIDLKQKKQPSQGRAKLLVASLLDSTAQVMATQGYAAVTTNRIAEVAGVSIGSIYEYFPNKQALVAATLARVMREIVTEVSGSLRTALALQGQPRAGIAYWLRAMSQALLRVTLREVPFLWEIPEVRDLSNTLVHIAQEGRRKSKRVVHFDDPEASTFLLMTMVWAAILQSVLYRPAQLSRRRLVDTLTEMVLKLL
jgi:AcrR family transcriptional regulator